MKYADESFGSTEEGKTSVEGGREEGESSAEREGVDL